MKNQPEKNWETTWQKDEGIKHWLHPDSTVVSMIDRLQMESVKRVLDLGFGIGRHLILFAREEFETYGVEPTQSGLMYCEKWLTKENLNANIRNGDMSKLFFQDGFFDFVLSWNVIYHGTVVEMRNAIMEINRVLQPNGLISLTLNSTRNSWYGKGEEVEMNTYLNPEKGDGAHKHHYSDRAEVEELFKGWNIEGVEEFEQSLAGKKYPGSWHWLVLARKVSV